MSVIVDFFPKLNKKGLENSLFTYSVSATYQGHKLDLECEDEKASVLNYKVKDKKMLWHPNEYGLDLCYDIAIENTKSLFGENGIASKKGDKIGVAFIWKDVEASLQNCLQVGCFSYEDDFFRKKYIAKLPSKTLRGKLKCELVLYLKSAGAHNCESVFARIPGTILGVLNESIFIIEGNGSVFPIVDIEGDKNEPLWWVDWDCEDPNIDLFNMDHYCIVLNKNNPDYEFLYHNGVENPVMMIEILSSALQILISNVHGFGFDNKTDYQPGSISQMVDYLIKTFKLTYDPGNTQILAKKIRKTLIEKMNEEL